MKDLQILIAYKLEMLHFKSKNVSVIIFADDITGNQKEQKNIKAKVLKLRKIQNWILRWKEISCELNFHTWVKVFNNGRNKIRSLSEIRSCMGCLNEPWIICVICSYSKSKKCQDSPNKKGIFMETMGQASNMTPILKMKL